VYHPIPVFDHLTLLASYIIVCEYLVAFQSQCKEATRVSLSSVGNSQYQKGKTSLDLLEQETVSGNGISWAMCKSAARPDR